MSQSQTSSIDTPAMLNNVLHSMDVSQWQYLSSHISSPVTARIIVDHLDHDPALKSRYAGIYMRARDTVTRFEARTARTERLRQQVGRLVARVFHTASAMRQPLCSPTVAREPTKVEPLIWPDLSKDATPAFSR